MGLEEDSKPMASRSFDDDDIAVMDVRLNVVLVEVVFGYRKPLRAVIVCGKMDLTR